MSAPEPRILIVDDDPFTLKSLSMLFSRQSMDVSSVGSAQDAILVLDDLGTQHFDCILTDFRMPEMTGLELMKYVRKADTQIAIILVTAESEKEVITDALKSGVTDYIEKPYRFDDMLNAVRQAIQNTRQNRALIATASEVKQITELQDRMLSHPEFKQQHPWKPKIINRLHPIKETGGDFVNNTVLDEDKIFILVGDVSGHDLKAGFISAYFQGMVRGMVSMGADIPAICEKFNEHLYTHWNEKRPGDTGLPIKISLATLMLVLDFSEKTLRIHNHGMPLSAFFNNGKPMSHIGQNGPPLGWFLDFTSEGESHQLEPHGSLYLWSDGLDEHAQKLSVNNISLAWFLTHQSKSDQLSAYIANHDDDILVSYIQWAGDDESSHNTSQECCFHQSYRGDSVSQIDAFQEEWNQSLSFCFPKADKERLWEISLCLREGLLNALKHGCKADASKCCYLTLAAPFNEDRIIARIEDEGEGYSSTLPIDQTKDLTQKGHISYGLTIIASYANSKRSLNNGSILELSFNLNLSKADE